MEIENTKAQMRKGVLEFCILRILSSGRAVSDRDTRKTKRCQTSGGGRYALPAPDPTKK
jgi:hypothetical protein